MFTVGYICHDGFISLEQVITFGVSIIETVWMNCFETVWLDAVVDNVELDVDDVDDGGGRRMMVMMMVVMMTMIMTCTSVLPPQKVHGVRCCCGWSTCCWTFRLKPWRSIFWQFNWLMLSLNYTINFFAFIIIPLILSIIARMFMWAFSNGPI